MALTKCGDTGPSSGERPRWIFDLVFVEKSGLETFLERRNEEVRRKLERLGTEEEKVGVGVEGFVIGVTFMLLVMRLLLLFFEFKVDLLLLMFVVVVVLFLLEVIPVVGEKSSSSCRLADMNGS